MYLTIEQIRLSLKQLEPCQMFYGTTFLVFKMGKLPIGETKPFAIDTKERKFLEDYYKPKKTSRWYYRPMRSTQKDRYWLDHKYAGSGSQSLRTRGNKAAAFIHEANTQIWGWQKNYVDVLKSDRSLTKKMPIFHLAVWLYREKEWPEGTDSKTIVRNFVDEYFLTEDELEYLFDANIFDESDRLLANTKVKWEDLESVIGLPPDSDTGEGATLTYLELTEVGPASKIEFTPTERLSLITGDNGLGKTFILESIWWALTGQWSSLPAYPRRKLESTESSIIFELSTRTAKEPKRVTSFFDSKKQSWQTTKGRPTIPGLLLYAKVDSSFAVWDPERKDVDKSDSPVSLVFSKEQVWNGFSHSYNGEFRSYSEGLIRDWVKWQQNPKGSPFYMFSKVLRRLSPSDLGILEPGPATAIPYDARQMPTINHPYGTTPIIYAAAGIKRVIALAYFIVWAWFEHQRLSEINGKQPQRRMVILIDEIEAHLHPRWQRVILPSLLDVSEDLSADLDIQFIIATHSPLVMTSVEPHFNSKIDSLWHLNLAQGNLFEGDVSLESVPFTKYGPSDAWLMSEVFDATSPRSIEATEAIEKARFLQRTEDPPIADIRAVAHDLKQFLAVDDEFWPLWKYFAERHGVSL